MPPSFAATTSIAVRSSRRGDQHDVRLRRCEHLAVVGKGRHAEGDPGALAAPLVGGAGDGDRRQAGERRQVNREPGLAEADNRVFESERTRKERAWAGVHTLQSSFVFSQVQWLDSARAGRRVFTYDIGLAPPILRDSPGTYPQDAVSCRH